MKKLTKNDIKIVLTCEEEYLPIEGNCSAIDEKTDKETLEWIQAQLEDGNEWAWCTVKVEGEYKGITAVDYLGGCSYKSREDFMTPGGYYDDMVDNVVSEINGIVGDVCRDCCGEE